MASPRSRAGTAHLLASSLVAPAPRMNTLHAQWLLILRASTCALACSFPSPLTPLTSSNVRRGTLIFTQRVFDVPIMGSFKLLHVMLWLTAVAFLSEPGDNILRCLSLMLKATALGWPWLLQGASLCA